MPSLFACFACMHGCASMHELCMTHYGLYIDDELLLVVKLRDNQYTFCYEGAKLVGDCGAFQLIYEGLKPREVGL